MQAPKINKLNIAEYLAFEAKEGLKCEYFAGDVYAMAGGTVAHGMLCGNVYAAFRNTIKASNLNCTALNSEIKLHIATENCFVYPDAMVICSEIEYSDTDKNAVTNPTIVVEVLSNSTAAFDRGDKFYKYRQIACLQEYILIEQDKIQIEVYSRQIGSELWKIVRFSGEAAILRLQSLNQSLMLAEIYEGVLC